MWPILSVKFSSRGFLSVWVRCNSSFFSNVWLVVYLALLICDTGRLMIGWNYFILRGCWISWCTLFSFFALCVGWLGISICLFNSSIIFWIWVTCCLVNCVSLSYKVSVKISVDRSFEFWIWRSHVSASWVSWLLYLCCCMAKSESTRLWKF